MFFAKNYYLKAKDNLEQATRLTGDRGPSIDEIWREAMRIAWPEPEPFIEVDLADGQALNEEEPFWVTIDGERCLVRMVNGILVFIEKAVTFDTVDEWFIKKLGLPEPLVPDDESEPEEPDYTGPKGP